MPRTNRIAPGGWVFHVLNRGNARGELFEDAGDYLAFEAVLGETVERLATPIWEKQAATRLGLQSTLRPRGRPRKTGRQ